MGSLALSPVFWVTCGGILLFGMLVILRFSLALAREAKGLGASIRRANERLHEAIEDVSAEARRASEKIERFGRRRARRR